MLDRWLISRWFAFVCLVSRAAEQLNAALGILRQLWSHELCSLALRLIETILFADQPDLSCWPSCGRKPGMILKSRLC